MRPRLIESAVSYASCATLLLFACPLAHAQSAPGKPKAEARAASAASPATAGRTQAAKARRSRKNKKSKAADARQQAALANAVALMRSSKREDVEAGIQSLGLLGSASAVEPLAERIRQGLPPDLLETAITTLMALGQPNAGPVLYELSLHRRPEVRLRAVEAVAASNPPGAERALLIALSDSDARVRAAAAVGLGDVGTSAAIERLFLALDRGNLDASMAIGKLVAPGETRRLTGYLGEVPFRNLGPALAEVLRRPDVPERVKLDIVVRLQEVGTPEVKGYLADFIAAGTESLSPKLSRALLQAMQEIAE